MTEDSHKPRAAPHRPDAIASVRGDATASEGRPVEARADEVEQWTQRLLGGSLSEVEGVLQTAAVWRRPGSGELVVLKIDDETPKSASDFLLLQLGRARAEAIVTTGKILRDEPDLDFALGFAHPELPASRAHLEAWRADACGLASEAKLVVLSSGRDLPLHHPALEGRDVTVLTGALGEERLASASRAFGIEVVAVPASGVLGALAWLAGQGTRRVTVEAGPSTSSALYGDSTHVAALSLSTLQQADLPESLQGGAFLTGAELHERMQPVREASTVDEQESRWSFQLWRSLE
ncbi:MAG: hypothetical protein AAGK22_05010 [Acidobacteriota bacterium]